MRTTRLCLNFGQRVLAENQPTTAPASVVRLARAFSLSLGGGLALTSTPKRARARAAQAARARSFRGKGGWHVAAQRREEGDKTFPPLGGSGARGAKERGTARRRAAARRAPEGAQRLSGRGRRRARRVCRARTVRRIRQCIESMQHIDAMHITAMHHITAMLTSHTVRTATAPRAAARRAPAGAQRPSGRGRRRAGAGKPAQRAQGMRERPLSCGLSPQSEGRYPAARSAERGRYPAATRSHEPRYPARRGLREAGRCLRERSERETLRRRWSKFAAQKCRARFDAVTRRFDATRGAAWRLDARRGVATRRSGEELSLLSLGWRERETPP